jgi:hypothetical protein
MNLRGHHPAASNSMRARSGMGGADRSASTNSRETVRDMRRMKIGTRRHNAITNIRRTCHILRNYSRNVTCHKPERCGLTACGEHNLQNFCHGLLRSVIKPMAEIASASRKDIRKRQVAVFRQALRGSKCSTLQSLGQIPSWRHSGPQDVRSGYKGAVRQHQFKAKSSFAKN